ncbi:MAG: outer membrane protein transport protein, partial [Waddliaceae bacterium]
AGAGTSAYDASVLYFNPAGMTKICGNQLVSGMHFIFPSSEFENNGSFQFLPPPNTPLTGGDGGNAGKFAAVPHFYAVSNWNDCVSYGIGINSPFGLATVYDGDWVGRYYALKSAILSLNINPSIAYRINDCLSIGAGFSAMYFDAELTNAIDFGSILFTVNPILADPQNLDGFAKLKGNSWGWGGNVGILWDVTPCTRLGLSYRSQIKHHLRGNIVYDDVPDVLSSNGAFLNTDADAEIVLPDLVILSVYHTINSCFAVMADVSWTHWSLIQSLNIETEGSPAEIVTTLNWKDTWRCAVGLSYFPNQCMTYRVGFAFDESPTPNSEYRSPRIPDQDRYWLTLGAGYVWNCIQFDAGYAHIFVPAARVDKTGFTDPTGEDFFKGALRGKWDQHVNIFSVQAAWNF